MEKTFHQEVVEILKSLNHFSEAYIGNLTSSYISYPGDKFIDPLDIIEFDPEIKDPFRTELSLYEFKCLPVSGYEYLWDELEEFDPESYFDLSNIFLNIRIQYIVYTCGFHTFLIARSSDLLQHVDQVYLPILKNSYHKYIVMGSNRCVRDLISKQYTDIYCGLFEGLNPATFVVSHWGDVTLENRAFIDALSID